MIIKTTLGLFLLLPLLFWAASKAAPFSLSVGTQTAQDEKNMYQEIFDVRVWLLKNYSGTGKSSYLGT